jgi:3-oxoacyl-[acyl-carrier-protein] synthase-3
VEQVMSTAAPRASARVLRGSAIDGVGAALPERVVTSAELAEDLGVDEHWIVKRSGIRERRWAEPDDRLPDLAERAARQALERAGIDPQDVELLMVATESHEQLLPGCSPHVARQLGATRAGVTDICAACTGLLTGLEFAAAQIETGRIENALIVGAAHVSKYLAPSEPLTYPIMGDGAGAVVVSAREGASRIGPSVFLADGSRWDLAYATRDEPLFRMAGGDTFAFAVDSLADVTRAVLDKARLTLEDVDVFAYHQANGRILRAVGTRLGLPEHKVLSTISWTGNTSAASIPIALDDALRQGRLEPGDRVLMAAIGGGAIWGACLVEWAG